MGDLVFVQSQAGHADWKTGPKPGQNTSFAQPDHSPENRGVPGSSPGLAIV
jgi:hypothetical protein